MNKQTNDETKKTITQWIKQTNKQTNGQWGRSKKRAGDERDPGEKMRALRVARAARIFNRSQLPKPWTGRRLF